MPRHTVKALLGPALMTAVLVPAASAAKSSQVSLALLPLPKSALGAAARPLALARDSGVVSNAQAASQATGEVTAKQLKRLGRLTGYLLDYGTPFGTGAGVHEIQTEVDRYRSAAAAGRGLVFWRKDAEKVTSLRKLGLRVSVRKFRLSGIRAAHWAYLGTLGVKGLATIYSVSAAIQEGDYIAAISTSAGSPAAAKRLVPRLARRLTARVRLALEGRLHGRPVKVPPALRAGPPAHGPKPAALVLHTSDLAGSATVTHAAYAKPKDSLDPNALSAYDLTMMPAGPYVYLAQEVLAADSPLEAKYFAAVAAGAFASGAGLGGSQTTPVDVSSAGDGAFGEILKVPLGGGRSAYEAIVVLSRGAYIDWVVGASTSPLAAANVSGLAQAAAKRLDAGVAG